MKNRSSYVVVFAILLFVNQECFAQKEQTNDPYLWLEEIESVKSLDWVKAQNALSEKVITTNPLFEPLRKKYLEVFNDKDKIAYPNMVGDYVYNLWQDEKNERGVWRRMLKSNFIDNKLDWEVVLDLDKLSEMENKKWVFKGAKWLKPDYKVCLVSLSDGGKRESEIREFDVESKDFVENGFFVKESKSSVSWINQNTILVSTDFGEGTLTNSGYPRIAKKWKRGTSIEEAEIIYEGDTTVQGVFHATFYSNNMQYTFILKSVTTWETEWYYLSGDTLQKIDFPLDAWVGGIHKNKIILSLRSDWNVNDKIYKAGSLISFDLNQNLEGNLNIKTIYQPNEKSSFVSMNTSKDFIVVNIMENVQNKLIMYRLDKNRWIDEEIKAPEFGSINLTTSSDQSNDYFFTYSNFITPTTLYHGNENEIKLTKKLNDTFNAENLVVQQYTATSKDGTSIPYFIVHNKDMKMNSINPTMIYAYGGFGYSQQPNYSSTIGIGWLEQGGVYVLANIRGGGEFGPSWHQAAMKEKRQNAYDDFYAVSEDLIGKKITSPEYLGAFGWSNGGLMAGVVFTQRPDLYKAVVLRTPLLDMKRYSKLPPGASWIGEFGNPDIPEEWEYIKKYSPYHNVFKDKKYPEVFFITSTNDDRVHPGHARKMAAKMNDMGHPFIYHETIEGGHDAASTNAQQAYLWASIYTYFNMKLNKSH